MQGKSTAKSGGGWGEFRQAVFRGNGVISGLSQGLPAIATACAYMQSGHIAVRTTRMNGDGAGSGEERMGIQCDRIDCVGVLPEKNRIRVAKTALRPGQCAHV